MLWLVDRGGGGASHLRRTHATVEARTGGKSAAAIVCVIRTGRYLSPLLLLLLLLLLPLLLPLLIVVRRLRRVLVVVVVVVVWIVAVVAVVVLVVLVVRSVLLVVIVLLRVVAVVRVLRLRLRRVARRCHARGSRGWHGHHGPAPGGRQRSGWVPAEGRAIHGVRPLRAVTRDGAVGVAVTRGHRVPVVPRGGVFASGEVSWGEVHSRRGSDGSGGVDVRRRASGGPHSGRRRSRSGRGGERRRC